MTTRARDLEPDTLPVEQDDRVLRVVGPRDGRFRERNY